MTSRYGGELERHKSYRAYGHYLNPEKQEAGAPGVLVFQGSYMNNFGTKYLAAAFGEYVHVHDYQNVMELPYYFNIFQPDCVIFEVAEYTLNETYFKLKKMQSLNWNPALDVADAVAGDTLDQESVVVEAGEALTRLTFQVEGEYVWLTGDAVYDLRACEGGFEVTVPHEALESAELKLYVEKDGVLTCYEVKL